MSDFEKITKQPFLIEMLKEHHLWLEGLQDEELRELVASFRMDVNPEDREEMVKRLCLVVVLDESYRKFLYCFQDNPLVAWRETFGKGPWEFGWLDIKASDRNRQMICVIPVLGASDERKEFLYTFELELRVCQRPDKLDFDELDFDEFGFDEL